MKVSGWLEARFRHVFLIILGLLLLKDLEDLVWVDILVSFIPY